MELPVYHWWPFRTGEACTFEDLTRRLRFRPALGAGLGTRVVDVSRPWPAEQLPGVATVALDGALQVPVRAAQAEQWSNTGAQQGLV